MSCGSCSDSFPEDCACKTPGASAIFPQASRRLAIVPPVVEAFRQRDAVPLALLPLLARKDLARFQRAALRWHARYCHELRVYDAGEAQATLALLFMLGPSSSAGARALAELLQARDFGQAAEALTTWAEEAH